MKVNKEFDIVQIINELRIVNPHKPDYEIIDLDLDNDQQEKDQINPTEL